MQKRKLKLRRSIKHLIIKLKNIDLIIYNNLNYDNLESNTSLLLFLKQL